MVDSKETAKQKVLVIAYCFPPLPYSGTYRIIRAFKGLSGLGVELHGLTIKINDNIPNNFALLETLPEDVHIHRTSIVDPWLRYQAWKKKKQHSGLLFKIVNKVVSSLIRIITIPDHQIFWIPFAFFSGRKIIKKYNISTVLVSSPPNSSQLIGYLLKRSTGVKWLADMRDPIIGNVAQVNLLNPADLFSKIEKSVLQFLEKLVVKKADILIANTETHRSDLIKTYNTDAVVTIRNSFDKDDYVGLNDTKFDDFTISHVGSMYGLRKADILFASIMRLAQELSPEPLHLQLLFVGMNDPRLIDTLKKHNVEQYVKIEPAVPHRQALEIMQRSHLLLLIKATGEGSLGQIPAKFFEYLGTRNRILLLGPEQSEVAGIIRKIGAGLVIESDQNKMHKLLIDEYNNYLNKVNMQIEQNLIQPFDNVHMAKNIQKVLRKK